LAVMVSLITKFWNVLAKNVLYSSLLFYPVQDLFLVLEAICPL
jgi:hypothetical protein